jgi:hypothetical protein
VNARRNFARVNHQFYGIAALPNGELRYDHTGHKGLFTMLDVMVLRTALHVFQTMFGSLGVFFVYLSFLKPSLAMHAVLFLGAAMGIMRSSPHS